MKYSASILILLTTSLCAMELPKPKEIGATTPTQERLKTLQPTKQEMDTGMTRFGKAVYKGDIVALEYFLKLSGKGKETHNLMKAMHLAATIGQINIIKYIASKNPALVTESDMELTPLLKAAESNQTDACKVLLSLGAPVDSKTGHGTTALHLAAKHGNIALIAELKKQGADIHAVNQPHYMPFHVAIANGHLEACKHLCIDPPKNEQKESVLKCLNCKTDKGASVVHLAARHDNGILEWLKSIGANLNERIQTSAQYRKGNTALHVAAEFGALENIKYLHNEKMPLDEQNEEGETALHRAAKEGMSEAVRLLLSLGAKITNRKDGQTPLHLIVTYEKNVAALLQTFKAVNINLDTTDLCGTPALEAARQGKWEIVDVFYKYGAKVLLKVPTGESYLSLFALDQNAQQREKDGCDLLNEILSAIEGPNDCSVLFRATAYNIPNIFCDYVKAFRKRAKTSDADILDLTDEYGNTPLHHAVQNGSDKIIKCLLYYLDCHAYAKNDAGQTALRFAQLKNTTTSNLKLRPNIASTNAY